MVVTYCDGVEDIHITAIVKEIPASFITELFAFYVHSV